MTTQTFKASVQYGDWKGTAAADRSDQNHPEKWLKENRKIEVDEFLVGIEMWAGENHGKHNDPILVTFLLASASSHDTARDQIASGNPLHVRKIVEEMNVVDFFGLFKRFSVAISSHGMLGDHQYSFPD